MKVVHCPTKEEALSLLEYLHENGAVWYSSGKSLVSNSNWDFYGKDTCYSISNYKTVQYSEKGYYDEHYPDTPRYSVSEIIDTPDFEPASDHMLMELMGV